MPSSQLLILGNGFDLHCGLKSSYKDFFQSSILDNIGVQYGLRQKKAEAIGFWENLLNEYYKKFGNDNYRWCDIETIIKDTVLTIEEIAFNAIKSVRQGESLEVIKTIKEKTLINKEQGKNLTHKLLLENRLKIVEIP